MKYNFKSQIKYNLLKTNDPIAIETYLNVENTFFAQQMKRKNQDNLTILTIGNSIAAGYSMTSPIIPLLKRNNNLEKICEEFNIALKVYSRVNAYRNNEQIMHHQLLDGSYDAISFYTEQTKDYFSGKRLIIDSPSSGNKLITPTRLSYYYIDELTENKSLREIIENKEQQAIIVYSPCTGGIVDVNDHIPNNEKSIKRFLNGFSNDLAYFNKNLSIIETLNPNACTIVLPILKNSDNVLLSTAIDYANNCIKKVTNHYSNVYFMNSISFPYHKLSNNKFDVHPNEIEYQKLLVHLMRTINEVIPQHIDNNILINIINKFVKDHELDYYAKKSNLINTDDLIKNIRNLENSFDNSNLTYENALKYLDNNYPSLYVHTPKNSIESILEKKSKK